MINSPRSRYLYVIIRPWPKDFEIADPWMAPPCGLATELIVLDLADMEVVGRWENLGYQFVGFYLYMGRSKPEQKIFTCGEDIEQNNVQVFF